MNEYFNCLKYSDLYRTEYDNLGEVLSMYNFIRKYTQENSKNTSSQCDLTYY